MEIRGITLYQPYASLIACGAKTIETRSWSTPFRGLLAIHAAKRWDEDVADDCRGAMAVLAREKWPVTPAAKIPWRETLGKIMAVARLIRCEVSRDESVYAKLNRSFGDLSPGRHAWLLADIRGIVPPIACRGSRSLWTLPPDVEAEIRAAMEAK